MLIDSHSHIDSEEFAADFDAVLASMAENGVTGTLLACCSLKEYARGLKVAENNSNIWCSVGVHPSTEDDDHEAGIEELVELTKPAKVVAVGECGLDYFYNEEPLDWQRQRFATHIQAARIARLPIIVHSRDANADTIAILRDNQAGDCGFVLHCFAGDMTMAKEALDMGGYLSFSGIVTFKNAQQIQEVARYAPSDRILVETDSPYLAPIPFRGKRNDPSKVKWVAEKVAQLRGVTPEEIGRITSENFFRLFSKTTL